MLRHDRNDWWFLCEVGETLQPFHKEEEPSEIGGRQQCVGADNTCIFL